MGIEALKISVILLRCSSIVEGVVSQFQRVVKSFQIDDDQNTSDEGEKISLLLHDFRTIHFICVFIKQKSSSCKLNPLNLCYCIDITGNGLCQAVKRLPQLEKLHLSYISIDQYDINFNGQNCPQLKSLIILSEDFRQSVIANDDDALAIADYMPDLRHLKLSENWMTNDVLQAIINGCPHLESLDIGDCYNLNLDRNFLKECMKQIKDFKYEVRSFVDYGFRYSDNDFDYYDSDFYKSD
ncbi:unnamed protein product [Lactuca virosa]|uniref:Uncharacterized protein n=1 Tax=Lactuca virosa TaxID=75947 RepID=A0AAU9PFW5_9ASTR|nr:unnamed protein product [Lactuca virosa]